MSSRPAQKPKRERLAEAEAENTRLKQIIAEAGIAMNGAVALDPIAGATDIAEIVDIAEAAIAREIVERGGNAVVALEARGFKIRDKDGNVDAALVRSIISRPGLMQHLSFVRAELEEMRPHVIRRVASIVLHSPNEESVLGGATWLAKMGGWFAPEKALIGHVQGGDFKRLISFIDQFKHEPGESAIVETEALDRMPALTK